METKSKNKAVGPVTRTILATLHTPRRLIAGELAIRLANVMEADPTLRQSIVTHAMCIGQWLNNQATPGRWDLLDPEAVLRAMGPLSPRDESNFLYDMAGLLIQACLAEGISPEATRRLLQRLFHLATDPDLKHTFRMLLKNLDLNLRSRLGH